MTSPISHHVSRRDSQRFLRFTSPQGVSEAILAYAGSNAHSFAQGITQEIGNLSKPYHSTWWFTAPHPFSGSSISARQVDSTLFELDVVHMLDGNMRAEELAQHLNVPIGYEKCEVKKTYPVKGRRFEIPLDEVKSLYEALGEKFDQEAFAQALTNSAKDQSDEATVMISRNEQTEAFLTIKSWKQASFFCRPGQKDSRAYVAEAGNLTGPVDFKGEKKSQAGTELSVTLRPTQTHTFDKSVEQKIRGMGDVVERTLREATPTPAPVGAMAQARKVLAHLFNYD